MAGKQSKITSTRPPKTKPKVTEGPYNCIRCDAEFKYQTRNFPSSQSPLYVSNNRFLPWCRNCINDLYRHYEEILGPRDAIRRLCMKFDVYWNDEIFKYAYSDTPERSRMLAYIARANSIGYLNKTYDDTLDEEAALREEQKAKRVLIDGVVLPEDISEDDNSNIYILDDDEDLDPEIPEDVVAFWGTGMTPAMYIELERRLAYWKQRYPSNYQFDAGEEALLRQICGLEVDINRDRAKGQPVDKSINTLNTLLGSANMKPTQKKEAEEAYVPFGLEILKWENEDPIPEPDPEFADVDGMHRNITAWFVGHLAKMVGYKNSYTQEYEDELKKYTLERPTTDIKCTSQRRNGAGNPVYK